MNSQTSRPHFLSTESGFCHGSVWLSDFPSPLDTSQTHTEEKKNREPEAGLKERPEAWWLYWSNRIPVNMKLAES